MAYEQRFFNVRAPGSRAKDLRSYLRYPLALQINVATAPCECEPAKWCFRYVYIMFIK